MLLVVAGIGVSAVAYPTLIERWNDRLFHHAGDRNISMDVSWLTRRAGRILLRWIGWRLEGALPDREKLLADEGTTIRKFFLHISKQEQKERLQARLDRPEKNWQSSTADVRERAARAWLERGDAAKARDSLVAVPASMYEPVPIEPPTRTGCPAAARRLSRSGLPGPKARVGRAAPAAAGAAGGRER